MRPRVRYILLIFWFTLVIHRVTKVDAESGISSNRVDRIVVEDAFRKALGAIKGGVALLDTNASFRVSRVEPGRWRIHVRDKSDVPPGGLSILVGDDGTVHLMLAQTNGNAQAWLAGAKPAEPDRSVRSRPEVAFRQGIQALIKWRGMTPDSFFRNQGRITLSRAKNEWLMDVTGYSGTPLGGWWLAIKDDGAVDVSSGL